jgi:hypothetical protein
MDFNDSTMDFRKHRSSSVYVAEYHVGMVFSMCYSMWATSFVECWHSVLETYVWSWFDISHEFRSKERGFTNLKSKKENSYRRFDFRHEICSQFEKKKGEVISSQNSLMHAFD